MRPRHLLAQTGNSLLDKWLFVIRFFGQLVSTRDWDRLAATVSRPWCVGLDSCAAAQGGPDDARAKEQVPQTLS